MARKIHRVRRRSRTPRRAAVPAGGVAVLVGVTSEVAFVSLAMVAALFSAASEGGSASKVISIYINALLIVAFH
jgi:hypothetical protein